MGVPLLELDLQSVVVRVICAVIERPCAESREMDGAAGTAGDPSNLPELGWSGNSARGMCPCCPHMPPLTPCVLVICRWIAKFH